MNQPEKTLPKVRRPLPLWAQVLILLTVFAAGAVVGAVTSTRVVFSRMEHYRNHAEALPNDIVPRLQARLGLSDEQTERVREIISRRHPRILEFRNRVSGSMLDEFDAMEQEVASVLDADQAERWHAIAESVRARFLPAFDPVQ